MSFTADEYNEAKSEMLDELNKAMADAEDLRQEVARGADDAPAAARETPEEPGSRPRPAGTSQSPLGTTVTADDCGPAGP